MVNVEIDHEVEVILFTYTFFLLNMLLQLIFLQFLLSQGSHVVALTSKIFAYWQDKEDGWVKNLQKHPYVVFEWSLMLYTQKLYFATTVVNRHVNKPKIE